MANREGGSSRSKPHAKSASAKVDSGRGFPTLMSHSDRLKRVKREKTAPEMRVALVLRSLGYAFRRNVRRLPGSPDFMNQRKSIAIFVHGCFWHRHKGCRRSTTPLSNRAAWESKFARNIERDREKIEALRKLGYSPIVVWECETENANSLRSLLERRLVSHGRRFSRRKMTKA
jgi:DNA mismatch endonuclease, patch repair protein